MENKREDAIKWWNSLSDIVKKLYIKNSTNIMIVGRDYNTLTGREIELLYNEYRR